MHSGATSAAVEPTAENRPASGAGTPEKASHGVPLASVCSAVRAAEAVTRASSCRRRVDEAAEIVGAGLPPKFQVA